MCFLMVSVGKNQWEWATAYLFIRVLYLLFAYRNGHLYLKKKRRNAEVSHDIDSLEVNNLKKSVVPTIVIIKGI